MKPGFVINARQKEKFVARAVRSALEQTVPCEIILSYQESTDKTLEVMQQAVRDFGQTHHDVRLVECPIKGVYGMSACNAHFRYAWQQLSPEVEWIFQLSADDYSLPDRVKVCMEGLEQAKRIRPQPPSALGCTFFFEVPGTVDRMRYSGFPTKTGFVDAGEGLLKLAYGSTIHAFRRDFLEKMDDGGPNTADVYFCFQAALDDGFYVVCNPQHVHVEHAAIDNMGFTGKLMAATGDDVYRIAELNHFQLLQLYDACFVKAMELYGQKIDPNAHNACLSMIIGQAKAWLEARKVLHAKGIAPGVL